jgi:hypothetical protein
MPKKTTAPQGIVSWIREFATNIIDAVYISIRGEAWNSSQNVEPTIHFSGNGMDVVGYMNDYRLVSKIKPAYFAGEASGSFIIASSSNDRFLSPDDEVVSGDGDDEDVKTVASASIRQARLSLVESNGDKEERKLSYDPTRMLSPKDVFGELEDVPVPASFEDLDKKIYSYKRILDHVRIDKSRGTTTTIKDILQRLENRAKYRDDAELRAGFEAYRCTTDDMLNAVLGKYGHLKIGPADDFIPEMPEAALASMLDYSELCVKLGGLKPVFYVIAPATDFRKRESAVKKRDPILLVQSPIGFFWQIIGAWGAEEMISINEL